jgi:phenylalanyl-tRNA synthetase alpha chain
MSATVSGSDLGKLEQELLASIADAGDLPGLEHVRVAALGKKGRISELMARLGTMAPEERKAFGQAVNEVKGRVSEALEAKKAQLEIAALDERLANERADVTLPVRSGALAEGRIHPVSQVFDECVEIFADLGFAVAEGPDIETDDLNFSKLNIPPEQIRTMMTVKPPIRIIAPGRVYRCDSDQTHTPMFHQIEGLVIDEETHMGHLKWVLQEFCKAFFEVDEVKMRFRASHFPFTEPSAEVDIGAEAIGKPGQWLEILGCGMVHPNVIANCGLDPERYQGFAFGMGLDRIAMLKYAIPDLRTFFAADLRWLKHYGFSVLDVPTLSGGLSS